MHTNHSQLSHTHTSYNALRYTELNGKRKFIFNLKNRLLVCAGAGAVSNGRLQHDNNGVRTDWLRQDIHNARVTGTVSLI